jgi:hypothetical protein
MWNKPSLPIVLRRSLRPAARPFVGTTTAPLRIDLIEHAPQKSPIIRTHPRDGRESGDGVRRSTAIPSTFDFSIHFI